MSSCRVTSFRCINSIARLNSAPFCLLGGVHFRSPAELQQGLTEYFVDYNSVCSHQSLDYSTPDEVYRSGQGGGVHIVDKYRLKNESQEELNEQEGQRLSAA